MLHALLLMALAPSDPPIEGAAAPQGDNWRACAQSNAGAAIAACGALLRSGHRALAHYNRANAHYRKAQFERANLPDPRRAEASLTRAIRDYTTALRLDPSLAEAWINRGIAWYDKRQFGRAVADASEAIRLRPGLAEAWNNRSLAHHKIGQYDLALRDFEETIRLEKNYGNALINRAMPSINPAAAGSAADQPIVFEIAIVGRAKFPEIFPEYRT